MNKSEIVSQTKKIIAEDLDVNLKLDEIGEEDSLFEDGLGLDSIAIVELITLLEERFGFQFSDENLTKEMFSSISTLSDFIATQVTH